MKAFLGAALAAGLVVSPAFAQSPSGTWNGLPDRFQIDTGYFHVLPETQLRYNPARCGGGDIDLEKDLGLQSKADTFWIDGSWRAGRRHLLKLSFTRLSRDVADVTLDRNLDWGGEVYNAGLRATSTTSTDILGGYYRFALVRNERFEIGPTVGIGYLWLSAGIKATGTVTGPGGSVSRALDKSASTGSITGAVGGHANAWLLPRLVVRGDFLYIKVSPGNTEASVTDWRLGTDYYFFRNAGLGVQYKYDQYSYDRGIISSKLGGQITYKGFQVFASFLF